nr:hypothetical protein GTC16762_33610 [Pigmentibacter ruber]
MKKEIVILSSLILFSCKNNSSNTDNNNQKPPAESSDFKPVFPNPDDYYSPLTRPNVPPQVEKEIEAIKIVGESKTYVINRLDPIAVTYHDCRNKKSKFDCRDFTYNDDLGNFELVLDKIDKNKLKLTYKGKAILKPKNDVNNYAYIDCTSPSIYELEFYAGSYVPFSVKEIQHGCTVEGNIIFPLLTNKMNWLYEDTFMSFISFSTSKEPFEGQGIRFDFMPKN